MTSFRSDRTIERIGLQGLTLAAPQVLGGIRLVPVLRDNVQHDLRLTKRSYAGGVDMVSLDRSTAYYSYIPHAFVADWSADGSPVASFGTQMQRPGAARPKNADSHFAKFGMLRKLRSREDGNRLRFVPLHLAMEGFLTLHFGGPNMAWEEYSRSAMRDGLSPRRETSMTARSIRGLEDALRVFEIHEGQVGVLVFVADALASAFVVSHPEDYQALHETLLCDFYGELIYMYGLYATETNCEPEPFREDRVNTIDDLRTELQRVRSDFAQLHRVMATQLLDRPAMHQRVYEMGPFRMERFMTDLDHDNENHIGEMIVRQDGTLEYLKSYRLSAAQCQRAYFLMQLADSQWNVEACARKLNVSKEQLMLRIEKAGFGYLFHQHVLDAARKK